MIQLGRIGLFMIGLCSSIAACSPAGERDWKCDNVTADIVVYGGTSSGVAAAVKAARVGKKVVVLEPTRHLGGLSSSGLGATDSGKKEAIGGISLDFYRRLYAHYNGELCEKSLWTFEPHVAEKIFNDLITENGIQVYNNERLDLEDGVSMEGGRIRTIKMESGRCFHGKIFIDATYEGDLMAKAGVSYAVGRESNEQYGETLDGIQKMNAIFHQFIAPVDPYLIPGDSSSGLLPGIEKDIPSPDFAGDNRIQAYCFRMCLTDAPDNKIPFPKPNDYDPLKYELLLRTIKAKAHKRFFFTTVAMPNNKTDSNNKGPVSTDYIGMNYDYPEGDYQVREKIIAEHKSYQQGFMWFLANDPRVPQEIREKVSKWGLAKDEFVDNDNWPYQLYIREARRMVSDYVMTQHDCQGARMVSDSIGLASYPMDSHHVQRYVDSNGYVRNEGDVEVAACKPYPISYRSIIPKKSECENLLVPVCLSASHIAFGSIRMEPVFMILGESAATAACFALDQDISVQEVEYADLQKQLEDSGQILKWQDSKVNSAKRNKKAGSSNISIVPAPANLIVNQGKFKLDHMTDIVVDTENRELFRIAQNLQAKLRRATGYDIQVRDQKRQGVNSCISLSLKSSSDFPEEAYCLDVSKRVVSIDASTPKGIFYGIQTLYQLFPPEVESLFIHNESVEWSLPCVQVQDAPRFPVRGFMLDSSREFQSKEYIKEFIEVLSHYKINILHWHLVDNESWRLEIKKYPQLVEPLHDRQKSIVVSNKDPRYGGNKQAQGYYTQSDVKEIIDYARDRYIDVIPEIEMPGHSTQVVYAMSGLMCDIPEVEDPKLVPGLKGMKEYCLGSESIIPFLEDVLSETIALFKDSPYIHIGGDEARHVYWQGCRRCQNKIKQLGLEGEKELQKWFMHQMTDFVHQHGKVSVAWADNLELGVPDGQIVHAWKRSGETLKAIKNGNRVVNSYNRYVYFDYPMTGKDIKSDWMPLLSLKRVYSFNPVPSEANEEQAQLVMGSVAALWTENVPQEKVYQKVFPRLLAFSEVVWSPQEFREYAGFKSRLKKQLDRLDEMEVDYYK